MKSTFELIIFGAICGATGYLISEKNKNNKHQINIMAKLSELNTLIGGVLTVVQNIPTQLDKVKQEILDALEDVDIPPEALEKIELLGNISTSIQTKLNAIDELNVDRVPPTP